MTKAIGEAIAKLISSINTEIERFSIHLPNTTITPPKQW